MKIAQLLEAPLKDYAFVGKGSLSGSRDNKLAKSKGFKEVLHKKLAHVGVDLYAYVIPTSIKGDTQLSKWHDSLNPEYYFEILPSDFKELFSKDVTSKIKTAPNAITTILFQQEAFDLTPWGFVHDLIHGLTVSNKANSKLLDGVEGNLIKAMKEIKLSLLPDTFDLGTMNSLPLLGTMKSAEAESKRIKNGKYPNQSEEFTTELFTQWLMTGDVKLTASRIAKPDKEKVVQARLDAEVPAMIQIFKKILTAAKGRIFMTSG